MLIIVTKAKKMLLLAVIMLLTACEIMNPEIPEPSATWAYSGPTIEASPVVMIYPPTEVPPNYVAPGRSSSEAAALPWDSALPPLIIERNDMGVQIIQIPLQDGTVLFGHLYEKLPGQIGGLNPFQPGLLLVGAFPDDWATFPEQLRDAGFTVLVIDMDDRAAAGDLLDVLNSLLVVNSVDPSLIAIVGVDSGADQAMIACALESLCSAAVLISPVGRDTLANVIVDYGRRPLLAAASRDDPTASDVVRILQQMAQGEATILRYDGNAFGTQLLLNEIDLQLNIISWLQGLLIE
jgi:hypothetical protein